MPKAMIRSAFITARLASTVPCIPIMPRLKGWSTGSAERPWRVKAIGMLVFSANSCSSAPALLAMTPWPQNITGRSLRLIMPIAWCRTLRSGEGW